VYGNTQCPLRVFKDGIYAQSQKQIAELFAQLQGKVELAPQEAPKMLPPQPPANNTRNSMARASSGGSHRGSDAGRNGFGRGASPALSLNSYKGDNTRDSTQQEKVREQIVELMSNELDQIKQRNELLEKKIESLLVKWQTKKEQSRVLGAKIGKATLAITNIVQKYIDGSIVSKVQMGCAAFVIT
jgi:hypothetical protein